MALLSNVPTLSYIRWQNLLITYQGTTYQITNNQTNKAYIYWDVGNPTELIASSRKLEEKSGQFYIFFNERGRYTVVPNDEIEINFSEGGAREAMTDTIIGFGQKIDANTQRFSTIEADIDGLKTTVGEIQNNGSGGSSSTISKIEQKVDEIELEVEHIERSFNEEQSMNNLRNNVSSSILSLQSTLGQFSSDMNTIMSDNKLSSEEKIQISSYTSSLSSSLSSVTSQIDTVTSHFQEQGDTEKVTRLTTAKNNLTNAVQNLTNGINVASTDNIFTNSEITTIISYFGKANTSINEAKNLIDDYILLGVGGDLVEEISRITLRQDEINLNVSRNEQTVSEDLSNLKQRVNEAELKITDDAIISTVSSTFYSKTEMDDILSNYDDSEDDGGVTFAVSNVDVMYYLSNSATELSGGSWNTTAPTWQNGKYIWSKTITTFTDGSTKETTPVCITGAKGEDGMDGVPGKDGEDGVVYYTWIRYADSSNGEGISNSPDGKEYIGFAYNKTTPTESNTPSDYKWSLIKGTDGVDGKDGTPYYTWIKYSDNENGSNMYDTPNDNTKYIGIAVNQLSLTESNDPSYYKWSKFKGEDGTDGVSAVTYYTWIRYADDENGKNMSNDPTNKNYIGFAYNKTTSTESNNPSDYTWSLIKGKDGVDGTSVKILGTYGSESELNTAHPSGNEIGDSYIVQGDLYVWTGTIFENVGQIKGEDGKDGVDGVTLYTWIKYSDNENGSNMYDTPNDNTKYIGIATNKITQTESNIVSDYKWSKFKGDDGVDGATYYTWIKYADDKNGNGMSNDPTGKLYIGFAYNKTTSTESNVASDYKWSLIKGTDGVDGEKGEDGTTYYTWIKYSDNSDGSNMYETPNNNTKYIGIAVNKTTPTESSNKSDYTWSKFRGENGVDGRSITSITEEYYLSTSKTTQTGGSWVTTPPTWEKGKYMWTRSKIVYDNPYGVEYTTPICDSSWDITNDLNIEIETTKKTVAQHSVELESITSKVQTNSSTILRIDGEIDSVETRVSSAEQKITDEAIINTVTSSSNWIESVGGVNLIPNSTAKYDLEGWLSMNNNNITRYENNQIYYNNEGGTGVNISGSVNGDLVENVSTLSYSYLHVLEPRGGGGLALLIQDKSGQTIMIDGGYEANASHCISYLNSLGIKKLDYYIISHAHSDHIEGAIDILEYFNAKKVIIKRLDTSKLPSVEFEWRTDTLYNEFMNMCTKKGVEVIDASSYNHIKISNDSYIKIYNTGNLDWTNYNSQSLMLLYVYKNNKVFLACDGTHNASNSAIGLIGKVDIFQAGHHGDGTEGGSSQKLIDELQPTHTIFASDWLANDIDQTKEGETLNRVSYYGGLSYSHGTGHNGDYVFTLNGTTVSTSAISTKAQSCWHLRDGNKWYWFKSNGVLAKNEVVTISSKNYRFKADGVAYCDEWYQDSSDNYYYYDPSCAMAINSWWQDKYGNWFYLQSGGVMAVNKTLTISSKEYRFKADGIAYCNEWYQNTSTKYWYFYGEDCAMFKNAWRENKFGEWYWLKSNGVMAVSETLTINGVSRTFNDQGVCINPN